MTLHDPIVWLDLETDGVAREKGLTLEIGCVLTDGLDVYVDEISVVVNPRLHGIEDHVWYRMPEVVKQMHTETGLWDDCLKSEQTEGTAMAIVIDWMAARDVIWQDMEPNSVTWGGKGVSHFDGPWLEYRMPQLHQYLRYWAHDVSPIRRLAKLAGIDEPEFFQDGESKHRARDDALNAWRAARWWRDVLYASKNPQQLPRTEKRVKTSGNT